MKMRKFVNRLRSRIFLKVFLAFLSLMLFFLVMVSIITSNTIFNILIDQEISSLRIILVNINNVFIEKSSSIRRILYTLNLLGVNQNSEAKDVFNFIETDYGSSEESIQRITEFRRFSDYIESLFGADSDITSISVYKPADHAVYKFYRKGSPEVIADDGPIPGYEDQLLVPSQDMIVSGAIYDVRSKGYCFTVSIVVKNTFTLKNIAVLSFTFNTNGIDKLVGNYFTRGAKTRILVTAPAGNIVYDSRNGYDEEARAFAGELNRISDETRLSVDGQFYLSTFSNNEANLSIAAVTSRQELTGKATQIVRIVLLVSFATFIALSWLAYFVSRLFSRRMRVIGQSILKIKRGDFSVRIPLGKTQDEIDDISNSINLMNAELEEYVQKEYISQLKQSEIDLKRKSTELKNLQSQINPHFLYNTLEAIRMKANLSGAREAGDMIMILSKLLRSSIKSSPIISIQEEIQMARLYSKLFELKYSNITISFEVDDRILGYGIVRNIIQPILENCIMHGLWNDSPNTVNVRCWLQEPMIVFDIADNGLGIQEEKLASIRQGIDNSAADISESIGILNVNERIRLIFGDECRLRIESSKGRGTEVIITVFAVSVEELMKRV